MIDQEIRDALQVEPSPEFLARVRTRIASEPAPSGWRWSWTFAAAGALAAALLVAVVMSRPAQQTAPATGAVQAFRPAVTSSSQVTETADPTGPTLHKNSVVSGFSRPSTQLRAALRLSKGRTARLREPEVLVNAAEMHALQGFIAAARNGNVSLTPSTLATPPAPMEFRPIDDIVISPITIDPLAPQGAQGERQ